MDSPPGSREAFLSEASLPFHSEFVGAYCPNVCPSVQVQQDFWNLIELKLNLGPGPTCVSSGEWWATGGAMSQDLDLALHKDAASLNTCRSPSRTLLSRLSWQSWGR